MRLCCAEYAISNKQQAGSKTAAGWHSASPCERQWIGYMCHLEHMWLCAAAAACCVLHHRTRAVARCTQFVWMCGLVGGGGRGHHHDLITGCFLGGYFNGLGGLSTHEIGWKKLAICSGPPARPQKNIFSVLIGHFRSPEHPWEWRLQRSPRRLW